MRITEEGALFFDDAQRILGITERAKKRFENSDKSVLRVLSLGLYSHAELFFLPPALRRLSELYPDLHPRLRVVPFRHIYRLLDEGDADAVIGFRYPETEKLTAVYKELAKLPITCVCSTRHRLADRDLVDMGELCGERLILLDPNRAHPEAARIQGYLMEGRPLSEAYFCESAEAATVLAEAGTGIAVLPGIFERDDLGRVRRIPIRDAAEVSFGICYKTVRGNAPLKSLISIMKESCSG